MKYKIFNIYYLFWLLLVLKTTSSFSQNFTSDRNDARLYGIHEVTITAADLPVTSTRYSIFPKVKFENGGTTINVMAFYDGNGNGEEGSLWKARLYVTKEGSWLWKVTDGKGIRFTGPTAGSFEASDKDFRLKGKLRKQTDNACRWSTERNTGNTFMAFGDTQYTLMDKVWTTEPDSSKGGSGDWDEVMLNSVKMGTTLMRAGAFGGYSRWDGSTTVGPYKYPRPNWPFKDQSMTGDKKEYDLEQMVATDTRLKYAINTCPGLYFELIISPKTGDWARYFNIDGHLDDGRGLDNEEKINLWTYTIARYSAYPNVNFQIVYDIRYSDVEAPRYPQAMIDANYALGKEWLTWLYHNDPFETMKCIGTGNDEYDPFDSIFYAGLGNCYIHDEAISDISGYHVESYFNGDKVRNVPIFHGEDTYEVVDIWYNGNASTPNSGDPEYYYRRIFWTDLLSGGYSCYGGGYGTIAPYDKSFDDVDYNTGVVNVTAELNGLNDIHYIKDFFVDNIIDIANYKPADYKAINGPLPPSQIQIAYDSSDDKYLIYHPNATRGEINYDPNEFQDVGIEIFETHSTCSVDKSSTPGVTLDLKNGIHYLVKWFDPSTGTYYNHPDVTGSGVKYLFTAPEAFRGKDAVLLLDGEPDEAGVAIMAHRGGRFWAPENTLAAFKKCADNDMDWETDLNLTADGEIILMHDNTLDRTTDAETVFGGTGISVNSKTLEQVKTLDAGGHFGSEYTGERVPTLDEFLDYFVNNAPANSFISMDTKLDKLSPGPAVYQSIIDKIAERDLFDRVFIEVFTVGAVDNTRNLKNGDKLNYAIWVGRDTTLLNEAISSEYFSRIHASSKIAYKADAVHAGGIPYYSSHPIDSQADWDAVRKYTIDGISTDKPDVVLYAIRNEIPICSIKSPINGTIFNEGATIPIVVSISDTDSSITKVEFYRNGNLIGQDTSYPYSYSWSGVSEGNYEFTVKAFDNGRSNKSAPVNISVEK